MFAPGRVLRQTWYADMIRMFLPFSEEMETDAHRPILSLVCFLMNAVIELQANIAVPPGL